MRTWSEGIGDEHGWLTPETGEAHERRVTPEILVLGAMMLTATFGLCGIAAFDVGEEHPHGHALYFFTRRAVKLLEG